ncbi:MAG: HAD family hydrolase [Vulcanimicrobiaceae bacterium]
MKLVAFDIDGTLIGRDAVMSRRVRDAVAAMRASGAIGMLVTGRMYRASIGFARELGFDAPIVCYQGAAIVDPASDEVLRDVPLPNAEALEIVASAQRAGLHVQLYRNDVYYCEADNRFSDLYAKLAGFGPTIVSSLRDTFAYSDATKAVVVADSDVARAFATEMSDRLRGRVYVTRSYPEFVEFLNPAVDKGDALRFVAERLGYSMNDVVAIGDSWNDAPLMRAAGFGIAMGSAPAELLAVADAVVGDVANDGVAEAIERYVLDDRGVVHGN